MLSSDQFPPAVSDLSLSNAINTWLPSIKHLWKFRDLMMELENSKLIVSTPIVKSFRHLLLFLLLPEPDVDCVLCACATDFEVIRLLHENK